MTKHLISVLVLFIIASCSNKSVIKEDIKDNLNKKVNLEMFETVQQGSNIVSFSEIRQKYKYISLVYLEEGCQPCYSKYIEWQKKMDTINIRHDYTIIFIIHGFNYAEFMSNVHETYKSNYKYFTIMDKGYEYLLNNNDIPRWIIDESVLIDYDNRIKMIGKPWLNNDMTKLFYEVCQ